MHRKNILETGIFLTTRDRNAEYGEPLDNLSATAHLWNAYLKGKFSENSTILSAEDVAQFNVLQKIARTFFGQVKLDTYIDEATYAAIAGECAINGPKKEN